MIRICVIKSCLIGMCDQQWAWLAWVWSTSRMPLYFFVYTVLQTQRVHFDNFGYCCFFIVVSEVCLTDI